MSRELTVSPVDLRRDDTLVDPTNPDHVWIALADAEVVDVPELGEDYQEVRVEVRWIDTKSVDLRRWDPTDDISIVVLR